MWSKDSFQIEVGNNQIVGANPSWKMIPPVQGNE